MRNFMGLLIVLSIGVGCTSAEFKQLARDQAANSTADLKDFRAGRLSAAQVEEKFLDDATSWATVNYTVNGVPIPPEYAPVKTDSKTGAPK